MGGFGRKFRRKTVGAARAYNGVEVPEDEAPEHDLVLNLFRGLYYSRIWFLAEMTLPMNILMVLRRQLPDGPWRFEYRFRYYEDDKAFDSKDRKSFYSGTFPGVTDEAVVVTKVTEAVEIIAGSMGLDIDVTVFETDDPEVIFERLKEKPYFRTRMDASGAVQ